MINGIKEIIETLKIRGIEILEFDYLFPKGESPPKAGTEFDNHGVVLYTETIKKGYTRIYIVPMSFKDKILISFGNWSWGTHDPDRDGGSFTR